jgi:AhpD family alkylhydroperoxidase
MERRDIARIPPVPRAEWTPAMQDMVAFRQAQNPAPAARPAPAPDPKQPDRGSNVLGLFANHPELGKAYFAFSGYISYRSGIPARHREMVILRVAALRHAEYEWAQHVQMGRAEGITDAEIEAILAWPQQGVFSPIESAMLTAVDELVADARISDATWAVLAAELGTQQLMDLLFTIGAYELLALVFNSCQLQPEGSLREVTPRLPPVG